MARSRPAIQNHLEYWPLRILMGFLAVIPFSWAAVLCRGLLKTVLLFIPKRVRLVKENIAQSFPDLSKRERDRIYERSLANFAKGLALYPRIPSLCQKGMDGLIERVGFHHIDAALKKGKGVLCVTAHYGSWEIMAIHVTQIYQPIAMLVRPLDNPLLDAYCTMVRSSGGGGVIDNHRVFKDGLRLLKNNGTLGILIDQNFAGGGVFVDFFGRLAATTPLASILARRTGCVILPMHNEWHGSKIRIICDAPFELSKKSDLEQANAEDTAKLTKIVEGWVRKDPGQWFWLHNRWKRQLQEGETIYEG